MREDRITKFVKRCIASTPKGREGSAQELRLVHVAARVCRGGVLDATNQELRAAILRARREAA